MARTELKKDGQFFWFDPSSPPKNLAGLTTVGGTLETTGFGRSTLSLTGMLDSSEASGFHSRDAFAGRWIAGLVKGGGFVLLGRVQSARRNYGTIAHESFIARDCLHFPNAELGWVNPDEATRIRVSLEGLDEWLQTFGITANMVEREVSVSARTSEPHTYELQGRTLRFVDELRTNQLWGIQVRSIELVHESYFEFEHPAATSLKVMKKDLHLLEDLLLLLTNAPVQFPWPELFFGYQRCVYRFERSVEIEAPLDRLQFWAEWPQVADRFGHILAALEREQDLLGPGLYLYLGVRRGSGMYLENRYATSIWGLEALHRKAGKVDSQEGLQAKIERILTAVDGKDRRWLSGRLKNAGEPNLEGRLYETFSELDVGLDSEELRTFCAECADLRNQLSHFGGQRVGTYDEFTKKLWCTSGALQPLYHAVLLQRIGFPQSRVRHYFSRSPQVFWVRSALREAGLNLPKSPVGDPASDEAELVPEGSLVDDGEPAELASQSRAGTASGTPECEHISPAQ